MLQHCAGQVLRNNLHKALCSCPKQQTDEKGKLICCSNAFKDEEKKKMQVRTEMPMALVEWFLHVQRFYLVSYNKKQLEEAKAELEHERKRLQVSASVAKGTVGS